VSLQRRDPRAEAHHFLQQAQRQGPDVFLSTDQGAQYVGCPTRAAFREWLRRARVPVVYRGRRVLVSRLDLEAELRRRRHVR
jgi:hypothetical protein